MPSINGQIRATDSGLGLVLENQHIIELEQNITNTTEQKFYKFFSHNDKQYYIQFDLKKKEKEEGDNFVIPINLLQREGKKELYGVNMKNALSLKDNKKEIPVELHSFQKESKEASANRTPPRSVSSSPKNVSPRNSLSESSSSLELNKTSTENNAKVEELEQRNTNLQTKFDAAEKEKTELQQQLDNLTKDDTAIEDLFADGSIKTEIEGLIGSTSQELEGKIKDLCDGKLKEIFYERFQKVLIQFIKDGKSAGEIEERIKEALKHFNNESKIADLQQQLKAKDEEITALKAQPDAAVTKLEGEKTTLTNKIKDLEAQLNNQPNAAQLKDKEDKIKELEAKINQPNTEVESLKKDLQAQNDRVQQLEKENKELEAKNKTTEQPKQGNGAKYTATVGMGLAAGLIAFTALERTVRLEQLC